MAEWIHWIKDVEVRATEIDEQHRELFRVFNELVDADWDRKAKDCALQEMFRFTARYAVIHYSTEEKYVLRYSFPGCAGHKKRHDDFVGDVNRFIDGYEEGGATSETLISTISYLGNRTSEHIRGSDRGLGRFLLDKRDEK